jgi:hypothetical protein
MDVLGAANDVGNERLYVLYHDGAAHPHAPGVPDNKIHPNEEAYLPGWPVRIATVALELLPVVGDGPSGSPVLGNVDGGNDLEIGEHAVAGPAYILDKNGNSIYGKTDDGRDRTLLTEGLGGGSNSTDGPAFPAAGGSIFADPEGLGELHLASPTAGVGKLLDLVLPEDQQNSDNHLSLWKLTENRSQAPAFPREVNDLQFLTTPSAADVDGDGLEEVIEGSAYNDLHAFSGTGVEPGMTDLAPEGWPKFTGGWSASPPGAGDWDGDGLRDFAHVIREGRFFVWHGNGAGVCDPATWPEWGHDGWMTNNVETDAVRPAVIDDLGVTTTDGFSTIDWSAPGDDGVCGNAQSYDIRRLNVPLTNDNFSFGRGVGVLAPSPGDPGAHETLALPIIECDSYVAIQSYDADPKSDRPAHPANPSAVSNSVLVPGSNPTDPSCSRQPTRLTIGGERDGQTTDKVTLKATLESPLGTVAGKSVTFKFQGRRHKATTDADGIASWRVRVRGRAKETHVQVSYGGAEDLEASTDVEGFTVRREDTRLKLVLYKAHGGTGMRVLLRDADSSLALRGRWVRFFLNGKRIRSKRTGPDGRARIVVQRHRLEPHESGRAVFRGGRMFVRSRASKEWKKRN